MNNKSRLQEAETSYVPEIVITRLPQYVRILASLQNEGVQIVSSQQLGEHLHSTPTQIRKDLSYLGKFGKQSKGYDVEYLSSKLKKVLGLDRKWNVCLVGVGSLGQAILSYPGFVPEGFNIAAAFDANPTIIGSTVGQLTIKPMSELSQAVKNLNISIGIVAVPGTVANDVINQVVECGISAILNYAPIYPQTHRSVKVRNIDPVLSLQSMTYYLVNS